MTILRESPWYSEILEEGIEEGRAEGREEATLQTLLLILEERFGTVNAETMAHIRRLSVAQMRQLIPVAIRATSQQDVAGYVAQLQPDS